MGDGGYRAITGMGNRKYHKWLCDCKGNRTTGRSDLLLRKVNFVFSKFPYSDSSCLLYLFYTTDGRFSSSAATVAASIRISSINADSRDRSPLTAGSR